MYRFLLIWDLDTAEIGKYNFNQTKRNNQNNQVRRSEIQSVVRNMITFHKSLRNITVPKPRDRCVSSVRLCKPKIQEQLNNKPTKRHHRRSFTEPGCKPASECISTSIPWNIYALCKEFMWDREGGKSPEGNGAKRCPLTQHTPAVRLCDAIDQSIYLTRTKRCFCHCLL